MQKSSQKKWVRQPNHFAWHLRALIIKEKLGISDRETVEQIRENPYLQYFIGLSEYSNDPPFEPSMMVYFRERINMDFVKKINQKMVKDFQEKTARELEEKKKRRKGSGGSKKSRQTHIRCYCCTS